MAPPRPAPVWQAPQPGAPPLDSDTRCDVAVVGAGITGLTTAVQQWLAELAARRRVPMEERDAVTYATT